MNRSGKGRFLVVGGGISGLRVSMDLAETGHRVWLIDRRAQTGGRLLQLDHQFPNNHCGMCRMLPMLERDDSSQVCVRRRVSHRNLEFMPQTKLVGLAGEIGGFQARLRRQAAKVDLSKCDGCGECAQVCPVQVPDTFNAGIRSRKAIYQPSPYQEAHAYIVDTEHCTLCGQCEDICPRQAVRLDEKDEEITVEVDAVILATGYRPHQPGAGEAELGYGLANVLGSLQFERILSGTGPSGGILKRLSDGKQIHRIAWLQCVGSRDLKLGADYCSSVCCMFSIKQAVLAKQRVGSDLDTVIFYMDLRTFGRENERYRQQAEKEFGVRFLRARVHSVQFSSTDDTLLLHFVDSQGEIHEESFDTVILADGQRPGPESLELAALARIDLNPWGFFRTRVFSAGRTDRPGILTAGALTGPQDISESIINASAVALEALAALPDSVHSLAESGAEESSSSPFAVPSPASAVVIPRALIIGGGIAGMTAALSIADQGYGVSLVELSSTLGGNVKNRHSTLEGKDPQRFLQEMIARVEQHRGIEVHLLSSVSKSIGKAGDFLSTVESQEGKSTSVQHGVTILATGGKEFVTRSYGYGTRRDILSQNDIEQQVHDGTIKPEDLSTVVMIQCVDSREKPRNYCSRICCLNAIKHALSLKERNPDIDIYILYRDMMSYGFYECYYTEARRNGVLFIPYSPGHKPKVNTQQDKLLVEVEDPILERTLILQPDLLILGSGVVPSANDDLAAVFGVKTGRDGFFLEMDYKWRPVETNRRGVFVCGLARTPCTISESVAMAEAAAMRALRILSGTEMKAGARTAWVREARCMGCMICVQVCPFEAILFSETKKKSLVNETLCQGCGSCVVACPAAAIELREDSESEASVADERHVA